MLSRAASSLFFFSFGLRLLHHGECQESWAGNHQGCRGNGGQQEQVHVCMLVRFLGVFVHLIFHFVTASFLFSLLYSHLILLVDWFSFTYGILLCLLIAA